MCVCDKYGKKFYNELSESRLAVVFVRVSYFKLSTVQGQKEQFNHEKKKILEDLLS